MAYGRIKADTLVFDNSGSDVELTVSAITTGSLSSYAPLAGAAFTGGITGTTAGFTGNVGIGTTSPSNALDVGSGNIEIGGGNNTALTWSSDVSSHYLKFTSALNGLTLNGYGGLAFETNGANERMRIDSSGRLLVGTSSSTTVWGYGDPSLQLMGDYQGASASFINNEANTNSHAITLGKTRNGSIVANGDTFGSLVFSGDDGNGYTAGASISANVDGAPGDGDMPGRLVFSTTADGASSPTERMRIDSSGRVGINTTTFADTATALVIKNAVSGSDHTLLDMVCDNNETCKVRFSKDGSNFPGYISYETLGQELQFVVNSSERLRIDSSGNVGIGTTTASDKLSIAGSNSGDFRALTLRNSNGSTGSTAVLTFEASGGTEGHINSIAAQIKGVRLGGGTSGGLQFWTATSGTPAERMRIDSSGNLLIGTTALDARGVGIYGSGANGLYIRTTSTCQYWITNDGQGTGPGTIATIYNDTSVAGSITVNGTSTSFNTSSDYRLKENVVDIADGITRVKQLSPKRFNFIVDADRTVDGFIAHEAQAVVPEAITGTKDEVDDDGNAVMQGIDQSKLVPLLTAALQEAIAKIETLETKVAALEGA